MGVPETPKLRAEIEALQAEQEKIEKANQDADEYPEDVDAQLSEIEGRIDDGEEPDEEKLSGALVEDLTAHRTAALRAVLATVDSLLQSVK
jgi:predicted  nucleic acid-binding Zn-ribbon protein